LIPSPNWDRAGVEISGKTSLRRLAELRFGGTMASSNAQVQAFAPTSPQDLAVALYVYTDHK